MASVRMPRRPFPPVTWYALVTWVALNMTSSHAAAPPGGRFSQEPELTDYCATERFDVACKPGHVILMTSAQYGRMRSGRCIGGVALGCQTDVLGYMDSKCSGKQKCSLGVNDIDLHATPCPKDYKSYLEASYTCVPAVNTSSCQTKVSQHLVGPRGYITGFAGDGVLSFPRCSYSVEVEVGQRIAIFVYSFSLKTASGMSRSAGQMTSDCGNHVTLKDGVQQDTTSLCAATRGQQRHRKVFTSTANRMSIHIKHGRTKQSVESRFLIEYQAVGCPDIRPQKNSWLERSGDNLVVKCNITGDIWYLTCQGNQWIGQIGNCSNALDANGLEAIFGDGIPFQQGIALAVGVGIVVGAILGALLLLCVWTIRKGSRELISTTAVTQPQTKPKPTRAQESAKPTIRQVEVAPPDGKSRYDDRTQYPSLLTQDRSTPETAAYEYTHVWDPNFPSMSKKSLPNEKESLKLVPLSSKPHLAAENGSGGVGMKGVEVCSAHPSGGGGTKALIDPRPPRVHVYETPRGAPRGDDDCRLRTGELPMYFDLDLDPEGKCDHGGRGKPV